MVDAFFETFLGRHNIQHNDTQYDNSQHIDTQAQRDNVTFSKTTLASECHLR